ncbi:MAG: prolipoprotein diacylglyceryl transferase, partial [Candidatus Caccosoma sp.]|nr:prolipoprotein diacylglyceryl transferase [Candidatus Caccosoma sp.]
LAAILFLLAYKFYFLYTMPLYMVSYGIFRFLIEFIRGDERGAFLLNLSPAQWISILLVIGSIILFIFLKKYKSKNEAA